MAQIQYAKRLLNLKIAYYGPRGAGKAASLAALQQRYLGRRTLGAVELAGETAYTSGFLADWLEPVRGLAVNLQLFSVPGHAFDRPSSHRLVLEGADGVVFVADSAPGRLEAGLEALRRLEQNLREHGEELTTTALAFQWNKRDLPDALPIDTLRHALDPFGAPAWESVATEGRGLLEPLQAVARAAVERIEISLEARDFE